MGHIRSSRLIRVVGDCSILAQASGAFAKQAQNDDGAKVLVRHIVGTHGPPDGRDGDARVLGDHLKCERE